MTSAWCNGLLCSGVMWCWRRGDVMDEVARGSKRFGPCTAFGQRWYRRGGQRALREAATCPMVRQQYHHPPGAKGWQERVSWYGSRPLDGRAQIQRLAVKGAGGGLWRGIQTVWAHHIKIIFFCCGWVWPLAIRGFGYLFNQILNKSHGHTKGYYMVPNEPLIPENRITWLITKLGQE